LKQLTIENLCADGACDEGLDWITPLLMRSREPGPTAAEWLARPDYYLWAAGRGYEVPDLIDACAKQRPGAALWCAAHLLTPERRDACAVREPVYALQHAARLLTPQRLDWCAEQEPRRALMYAANLLSPERINWCAEQVAASGGKS